MNAVKFDEGRLMQLLVTPIVSEKATMVAEKSNTVTFKVLRRARAARGNKARSCGTSL